DEGFAGLRIVLEAREVPAVRREGARDEVRRGDREDEHARKAPGEDREPGPHQELAEIARARDELEAAAARDAVDLLGALELVFGAEVPKDRVRVDVQHEARRVDREPAEEARIAQP